MIQNTVLEIAQQVAKRIGATQITTIEDASDTSAQRILGQINNEVEALIEEYDWQVLRKEAEFTTDGSTYYELETIAPGFSSFNTFYLWDTTNQRTSSGLTPDQALANEVFDNKNIYRDYILRDNKIYFTPNIDATETRTFKFFYISEYPIENASGIGKQWATLNTDVALFPAKLIIRGVIYRWKAEQGQVYIEEKLDYQRMLDKLMNKDLQPKAVNQGGPLKREDNIPEVGYGS